MNQIQALGPEELRGEPPLKLPHVLLMVDQFMKSIGGGERIVLKLAGLLPEFGYRVSILTFFVDPANAEVRHPPCPVYVLPLERTYDGTAFQAARSLQRFLREKDVRIVQTFFESSDLWGGLVVKALSDAKLIWSRRDMGILRQQKHHLAYRILSGLPDRVVAVSEQVRRHSMEVDTVPAERTATVYNGLNLEDWRAPRRSADPARRVVITTVGNIRRVKGHDLLIRAAASLVPRFPNTLFTIAGDVLERDFFEELQALVRDLGLVDHVRFLGGIRQPLEHLAGADIFVLPSRSEGFSNAIIEAMAASLPVVATNVGGNAEAVQQGVSGLIVPAEDPAALAEALGRLLGSSELREQMGDRGKELAAQNFTTTAMMRKLTGIYSSLLG